MISWIRRLLALDDENLSKGLPFGPCEMVVTVDRIIGAPVVCGTRTNTKRGDNWCCSRHLLVSKTWTSAEVRRLWNQNQTDKGE